MSDHRDNRHQWFAKRLDSRIPKRRSAFRELAHGVPSLRERGVKTVGDLEQLLGELQDKDALLDAISLLGSVGSTGSIPALRRLLASSVDPDVREVAGLSLGLIGGREAVEALTDALRDEPCTWTRARFVDALAYAGLHEASDVLLPILRDSGESASVRGYAAESLGRLSPPGVLDDLVAALSDPEPQVRFFAAYALGLLGSRAAVEALSRVAREDDSSVPGFGSVAEEALEAIEAITSQDP